MLNVITHEPIIGMEVQDVTFTTAVTSPLVDARMKFTIGESALALPVLLSVMLCRKEYASPAVKSGMDLCWKLKLPIVVFVSSVSLYVALAFLKNDDSLPAVMVTV